MHLVTKFPFFWLPKNHIPGHIKNHIPGQTKNHIPVRCANLVCRQSHHMYIYSRPDFMGPYGDQPAASQNRGASLGKSQNLGNP